MLKHKRGLTLVQEWPVVKPSQLIQRRSRLSRGPPPLEIKEQLQGIRIRVRKPQSPQTIGKAEILKRNINLIEQNQILHPKDQGQGHFHQRSKTPLYCTPYSLSISTQFAQIVTHLI